MFIGRTDAEAQAPIVWSPDVKIWFTGTDPDAEKDWGQEEKGTTEDEMVDGITDSMDMGLGELRELVMLLTISSSAAPSFAFIFPSIWVFSSELTLQIR